jgi:hypothetical protein
VVGKVIRGEHQDDKVLFGAELGEESLIRKILRGYLTHVSVQVDSEQVVCSKCGKPTRKEGLLIHLCPGAWEIVKQPKVRELSIVATPAYEGTVFSPVGFAAALDGSLTDARHPQFSELSSEEVTNVGSSRVGTQEPEHQTVDGKEVKSPMPNESREASQNAQGIVNVAPGEKPPQELNYQDYMKQLEPLADQVRKLADEVAALKKASEASEAGRRLAEEATKKADDARRKAEAEAQEAKAKLAEAEGSKKPLAPPENGEEVGEGAEAKAKGKGIVALEEIPAQAGILGNTDWFKDLLKAHRKLTEGFK